SGGGRVRLIFARLSRVISKSSFGQSASGLLPGDLRDRSSGWIAISPDTPSSSISAIPVDQLQYLHSVWNLYCLRSLTNLPLIHGCPSGVIPSPVSRMITSFIMRDLRAMALTMQTE